MIKPATSDPRAALINWEVLSSETFPPIDEWNEDDWDDAALATLVHYYIERDGADRDRSLISFEEVVTKHGFTLDDLEAAADADSGAHGD